MFAAIPPRHCLHCDNSVNPACGMCMASVWRGAWQKSSIQRILSVS